MNQPFDLTISSIIQSFHYLFIYSIKQSFGQPFKSTMNIDISTNHANSTISIIRLVKSHFVLSTDEINHFYSSFIQSTNQPFHHSMKRSMNQPTNQSMNLSNQPVAFGPSLKLHVIRSPSDHGTLYQCLKNTCSPCSAKKKKKNEQNLSAQLGLTVERISKGKYAEIMAVERGFTKEEGAYWGRGALMVSSPPPQKNE